MHRNAVIALLAVALAGAWLPAEDDFGREGNPEQRKRKDALEGKAPPALTVTDWMNAGEGGVALPDLRKKVVVLEFWGVW